MLGWAGGRALFRTVNVSEIPRILGIRDCDEFAEGDLDIFDPRFPGENDQVGTLIRDGTEWVVGFHPVVPSLKASAYCTIFHTKEQQRLLNCRWCDLVEKGRQTTPVSQGTVNTNTEAVWAAADGKMQVARKIESLLPNNQGK